MSHPLTHGFRNLTAFSGRDRRKLFWPHAVLVLALGFGVIAIGMPVAMAPFFAETQTFVAAHPDAATVQTGPGSYSIQIDASHPAAPQPDLGGFLAVMATGVLLMVALLAAAVARRLHDTGRTALWGLAPVVFLVLGLCGVPVLMRDFTTSETPNIGLFGLLFLNNMAYLAALGILIVLLAAPGQPWPNRFGEAPRG